MWKHLYCNSTLSSWGLELLLSKDLKVRDFPAVPTEPLLLVLPPLSRPLQSGLPFDFCLGQANLVFRAKYK